MKAVAISVLGMMGLSASTGWGAVIGFDTNADYDANFVEVENGGQIARDAGGYLAQANTSTASTFIYNTSATGGTGGNGGTTLGSPRDKFGGTATSGGFTIQADIYAGVVSANGVSFGFYVKANDAATSGYAGLFRLYSNANGANFRLFDSNGNPDTAAVGTQIGTDQNSGTLTPSLAANTWYTIKLQVIDTGSDVSFTPSIVTQGGTLIHAFSTITDTTSAVTGAGQVGMRISSSGGAVRVDNFAITVVPEPASLALVALAGMSGLRRRR